MLIDTHTHLNLNEFDSDRSVVIANAKKAGVKKFIVPGIDEFTSRKSIEIAYQYPGTTFVSVGYHPYEAQHEPDLRPLELLLRKHQESVAIGECGLDYHIYTGEQAEGKKSRQKSLLAQHCEMAIHHGLPIILHSRDAFSDLFDVLDTLPTMPKGVIHCFSGGLQDLRMAAERNLFVGIDGNVTYSKQLALIVPHMDITRTVLETDAPYLTPVPHRGERNEPKHLIHTAKKVAELKNLTLQNIMDQTSANAISLFQLP
jgi:TatD DNase family protein